MGKQIQVINNYDKFVMNEINRNAVKTNTD